MNNVNRLSFGFESTLIDRLVQLKNNNNTTVWANKNFQQFTGAFIAGITDILLTVPLEFFAAIENALLLPIRAGSTVINYASWTAYPFTSRLGYSSQLTKFQAKQAGITDVIKTAYKVIVLAAGSLSTGTVGCVDLFINTNLNYRMHKWLDEKYDLFDNQFQLAEDKHLTQKKVNKSLLIGQPIVSTENKDLKKKITIQANDNKDLKDQIAQLEKDLASKQKALEQAIKHPAGHQKLKNKKLVLKSRLDEKEQEVERLNQEKQLNLDQTQALLDQIDGLKQEQKVNGDHIAELGVQIGKLFEELKAKQGELTQLRFTSIIDRQQLEEEKSALKSRYEGDIKELAQKLKAKKGELTQVSSTSTIQEQQLEEEKSALKSRYEEEIKELGQELEAKQEELTQLSSTSIRKEQQLEEEKSALKSKYAGEIEELVQELKAKQEESTAIKYEWAVTGIKLKGKIEKLKRELVRTSKELQDAKIELEELKKKESEAEEKQTESDSLLSQQDTSTTNNNIHTPTPITTPEPAEKQSNKRANAKLIEDSKDSILPRPLAFDGKESPVTISKTQASQMRAATDILLDETN